MSHDLDSLQSQLSVVSERLDGLAQRVDTIEERVDRLVDHGFPRAMQRLDAALDRLRDALRDEVGRTQDTLLEIDRRLDRMER